MVERSDLSQARTFVEATGSVAQGRWHVLPGGRVVFERDSGEIVEPAVVSAHDLESSPTWRELRPDERLITGSRAVCRDIGLPSG